MIGMAKGGNSCRRKLVQCFAAVVICEASKRSESRCIPPNRAVLAARTAVCVIEVEHGVWEPSEAFEVKLLGSNP
jgi:hypothetical protein